MIVLMLRSRTSYTHNQFEKSLILTAPPSTLVGRCAGSHTLNDFSSLRADSLVSTLILLLDEVEGGKNSRQSRDADRPRSLCRTTNERDERMFMALIYAQVYIIYIRPFNTHDHYANERIMRLWSRGAFLTLHNLDSYKTKNLLLIIRNCVAFLSNVFIYILTFGHFFKLTDNPLNCDCHLVDLARWLRNSTGNKAADDQNRRSAVCATPPLLENGLLFEAEVDSLTCEVTSSVDADVRSESYNDDRQQQQPQHEGDESNNFLSSQPTEDFIRLSSAQVQFGSAQLEGSTLLHTIWTVDSATLPYTCDAILVYELNEEHEALLDSYPVRCHSEERPNKQLQLTVKLSDNMKTDGQYRLCLVLFEGGHDDEASLLPGCSHSMTWQTLKSHHHDSAEEFDETIRDETAVGGGGGYMLEAQHVAAAPTTTQITAFYANVSAPQSVSVYMRIPDALPACQFTVAVFEKHRLLALKRLNCSTTSFTFGQLTAENRDDSPFAAASSTSTIDYPIEEYQVCATFAQQGQFLPPPDGERQADGDIVLTASKGRSSSSSISISALGSSPAVAVNSTIVQYEHCVVAKVPNRMWAVENTLVVIAVTVVFVLIAAALLLFTYLLARRVFFRRSKLLWCSSSSDPLSSSVPKATSRHILYVPENDYFTDSACSSSGSDHREETSTNV